MLYLPVLDDDLIPLSPIPPVSFQLSSLVPLFLVLRSLPLPHLMLPTTCSPRNTHPAGAPSEPGQAQQEQQQSRDSSQLHVPTPVSALTLGLSFYPREDLPPCSSGDSQLLSPTPPPLGIA